jgi:hypothetical protein
MEEEKQNLDSAIAGQVMSSWLPYGFFRRVVCLILFVSALGKFFQAEWIDGIILAILCSLMSPRIVGESLYFLGRTVSIFSKK